MIEAFYTGVSIFIGFTLYVFLKSVFVYYKKKGEREKSEFIQWL